MEAKTRRWDAGQPDLTSWAAHAVPVDDDVLEQLQLVEDVTALKVVNGNGKAGEEVFGRLVESCTRFGKLAAEEAIFPGKFSDFAESDDLRENKMHT